MQVTIIIEEKDFQNTARMSALRALFGAEGGTTTSVSSVGKTPAVLQLEPMESKATSVGKSTAEVEPAPMEWNAAAVAQPVPQQSNEQSSINPTHDSTGMPWDGRIHSPNRTINADGTWRKKKGLDPATLAAVEAELKQSPATVEQQAVNDTAASLFGLPIRDQPVHMSGTFDGVKTYPTQMTAEQAQDAMFGHLNQPQVQAPTTFPDLMKVVSAAVNAGKIDPVYIGRLTEKLGLASLADLVTNPVKIPAAYKMMRDDGKV